VEAFILGLSNGATCITYCAPMLVPYLLGEGKGILRNSVFTVQFLSGRLVGYLAFAVLAWVINRSILQGVSKPDFIMGPAYIVFSMLLIFYGFCQTRASCATRCTTGLRHRLLTIWPSSLPIIAGFVTGLSLCPPFLLAFTGAVEKTTLLQSLFFFFAFFLGTSIFFIPLPFSALFRGFTALRIVGRMAAGLIGVYYLYSGIIMFIEGYIK
jgi:sulfite exporter TauE/SafE